MEEICLVSASVSTSEQLYFRLKVFGCPTLAMPTSKTIGREGFYTIGTYACTHTSLKRESRASSQDASGHVCFVFFHLFASNTLTGIFVKGNLKEG